MSDLWDALDAAATAILARVSGTGNLEDGKEAETVSLNDQINAFKAVSEYALKRERPPPTKDEKAPSNGRSFSKVKGSLQNASERGSGRGKKGAGSGSVSDAGPDYGDGSVIAILNGGTGPN